MPHEILARRPKPAREPRKDTRSLASPLARHRRRQTGNDAIVKLPIHDIKEPNPLAPGHRNSSSESRRPKTVRRCPSRSAAANRHNRPTGTGYRLVEVNGFEPSASCVQSMRSPAELHPRDIKSVISDQPPASIRHTLLRPEFRVELTIARSCRSKADCRPMAKWWAWVDSNYRPHAYQACALTGLSYRPDQHLDQG